jgi:transcriptional regulator with XRE-family HTH domain
MEVKISKRILELMKEQNLTQAKLAQSIGMHQSNVSEWLSGKKEPSIASLWLLADFFDIDIDYLVGRKDF